MDNLAENVEERIEEHKELFLQKNDDYGNTWAKTGDIFEMLVEDDWQIESQDDIRDLVILGRVLDKLSRIGNLRFTEGDANCESLVDSLQDAGIYMFMMAEFVDKRDEE